MLIGFRDNYWELTDAGYGVQIPTCIQIESQKKKNEDAIQDISGITEKSKPEKSLTTSQTSNNRLVTKVYMYILSSIIIHRFSYS